MHNKQGCCILLATILRTLGQVKENSHEYEGEYAEPSAPLLRPPQLPPNPLYPYVIGEPVHIEPHSAYKNVWVLEDNWFDPFVKLWNLETSLFGLLCYWSLQKLKWMKLSFMEKYAM